MAEAPALEARDVEHCYDGAPRPSLAGVSLQIEPGEVVGLLGPNGAGKTTLARILATILVPTGGEVFVGGERLSWSSRAVRQRIGVAFGGDLGLYLRLSARDNLRYFGSMYGLMGRNLVERIDTALATVGLISRQHDRVETFSRGMRQRLHIARVILHQPRLVMLDEPSNGLDPIGARDLCDIIRSLAVDGRGILLTTHDLTEAEELCQRIVVLNRGRVVTTSTPTELRQRAEERLGTCVRLQLSDAAERGRVASWPDVRRVSTDGSGTSAIYTTDAARTVPHLIERYGVTNGFQVGPPSLDEAVVDILTMDGFA